MVIRKCPQRKVEKWGEYDKNYHFDYDWGKEKARGVSAVFRRESGRKIIDYGNSSAEEFDNMMSEAADGKDCKIVHSKPYEIDYKKLRCDEGFALEGFFYWKIFRYDVYIVKRNPVFMGKCAPLICKCLEIACNQPPRA